MLTKITIRNFKSFRHAEVDLGAMNLLVGANASGKSNFFDALRVLQGIGNGFTISEVLDGKPKSATSEVWEGIRGGSAECRFIGARMDDPIEFKAVGRTSTGDSWIYSISVSPRHGRVSRESLRIGWEDVFLSTGSERVAYPAISVRHYPGTPGHPPSVSLDRSRPVLGQFAGSEHISPDRRRKAAEVAKYLADLQRFDPVPSVLRQYSQPHRVERMGEHGENFAALVATICADAEAKSRYLEWLRELRPEEVEDVGTLAGAVGEPLFMLREAGQKMPAPVLSDGTLRFAAVVAGFLQPDMPGVLTLEELEKGIHANRARLLVELIRRHSDADGPQVVVTTHSPAVLAWLRPEEYATTFFCRRDPEAGEVTIQPVRSLASFDQALQRNSLGDLFAEGWMEAAS